MRTKRGILLIAMTVLLCIAQMFIFPLIDTPRMRENAAEAVDKIWAQGVTPEIVGGFAGARFDNYTAALIVKTAAYVGGESYLQKVLGGFRVEVPVQEDTDAWGAYCTYDDARNTETGGLSYSRYWHGYTLPLRVLLSLMTLSNIDMLIYGAELVLIMLSCVLLSRRGLLAVLPGWALTLFVMMPAMMGICVQFAPCMLIFLVGCVLLLWGQESIEKAVGLAPFFALLGILTSYLDLLTFPTVTLTLPLCICFCIDCSGGRKRQYLPLCLSWGLGYALMWGFKWVLCGVLLDGDLMGGVMAQMKLRLSSASNGITYTRLEALMVNVRYILARPAYLLAIAAAGLSLVPWLFRKNKGQLMKTLPLALPILLPILFMAATANHIYDHGYFTYRNLAGAVLGLYLLFLTALGGLSQRKASGR